jgi:cytidine deaminase
MKINPNKLLAQAKAAAAQAYAPYSKFRVGAALLAESGEVFCGANVENASYGLTLCAERSAAVCGVSAGVRKFTALALFSPDADAPLYPCGACLQVLAEFADDLIIYSAGKNANIISTSLQALLPQAFRKFRG